MTSSTTQADSPATGWPLLAAIIREVDGNNSLGAAALAEAILAHPLTGQVLPQGHEWLP
ncbi:MAG: hypothetical protein ACK54Y_10970 [Bacteroidota bacterium]|jgi:hypothetical protein